MAEFRKVCVIYETFGLKPPVTYSDSNERREETSDVDEHVENLESHVSSVGIFRVVVKLSDYSLKITFEKTVTECYDQKSDARKGKDHSQIGNRSLCRIGYDKVSYGHQDKSGKNGSLVVLGLVGYNASDQCQDIY